ncbi:hypothetical protein E2C01_075315 [Portunus trituberculatus]|uniref:Uncharacterized protein n=1 Tax=Portunus trituberculatus TaxID=210409 RepID=A0A5B7IGR9_PORTR|nr:hypothetical protein [Portunus trituberculatus]
MLDKLRPGTTCRSTLAPSITFFLQQAKKKVKVRVTLKLNCMRAVSIKYLKKNSINVLKEYCTE